MIYIYKTDTVWGIGAAIDDKISHLEICKIKKTSTDKPVSILFSSLSQVKEYFNLPFINKDKDLSSFFNDQMTLLLPLKYASKEIPSFVIGNSNYVGIRCLVDQKISRVIEKIRTPITTTSLNITGELVTKNEKAAKEFVSKHLEKKKEYLFLSEMNEFDSFEASTILQFNLKEEWSLIRGDDKKLKKYEKIFST